VLDAELIAAVLILADPRIAPVWESEAPIRIGRCASATDAIVHASH
jgi:hypothetical protein